MVFHNYEGCPYTKRRDSSGSGEKKNNGANAADRQQLVELKVFAEDEQNRTKAKLRQGNKMKSHSKNSNEMSCHKEYTSAI